MKITDYQKIAELVKTNVFLVDGDSGTKTIFARDLLKALIAITSAEDSLGSVKPSELAKITGFGSGDQIIIGSGDKIKTINAIDFLYDIIDEFSSFYFKRNIYRGNDLGSVFTSEQKDAIRSGTFKKMFLGDYWQIGGVKWRIVDIDYWFGTGDTRCATHHLVIMPDTQLYTARMNADNTTAGGYLGSEMYTKNLEQAKTTIYSAFGEDYVLEHREYLTNAASNGHASGGMWVNSKVELPNEIQMYGCMIFTATGDGTYVATVQTVDRTQLALMKIHPIFNNPSLQNQWLRDISTTNAFAIVTNHSMANGSGAINLYGVRPVFGITGET